MVADRVVDATFECTVNRQMTIAPNRVSAVLASTGRAASVASAACTALGPQTPVRTDNSLTEAPNGLLTSSERLVPPCTPMRCAPFLPISPARRAVSNALQRPWGFRLRASLGQASDLGNRSRSARLKATSGLAQPIHAPRAGATRKPSSSSRQFDATTSLSMVDEIRQGVLSSPTCVSPVKRCLRASPRAAGPNLG